MRFDSIKHQYQDELLPLTAQKESLGREIADLYAMRNAILEETAVISARNEALAQLNAQYIGRAEVLPENSLESDRDRRELSFDRSRPPVAPSTNSSTTAFSEESGDTRIVRIMKTDTLEMQAAHAPRGKFIKWPGSKSAPQSTGSRDHTAGWPDLNKPKARVEHSFQQMAVLRPARCDHCGDKMWGSQLKCSSTFSRLHSNSSDLLTLYTIDCTIAVHTRCVQHIHLPCSQQNGRDDQVGQSLIQAGKYLHVCS